MNVDALSALAGIAVSMTWAPGPNNAMLGASGANYGWRRSVPHAMGVAIGFPAMLIVVAVGVERLLREFPLIVNTLAWIGLAMMIWFAWRIATAGRTHESSRHKPLTFLQAVAFQWANPKAWALALYVAASYAVGEDSVTNMLLAAGAFLLSGLASSHAWALFGAGIGKALGHGWRLRTFNVALALMLVSSAAWLMLGS